MKTADSVKRKNILFKNRIVMPPMATGKATSDGKVSEEILSYYAEKTGCGLFSAVITEHAYVLEEGKAHKGQMSVAQDDDVEGLTELARVIRRNGALAILQISHAGSAAKAEVTGMPPVAPSEIRHPGGKNTEMPRALSVNAIEDLKKAFVSAAGRAKKAGFDGVELHSAHGYLLNQFLSPLSNRRMDLYGGEILNRVRLHTDLIREIKEMYGEKFAVFIRMGASDYMPGGLTAASASKAAEAFEKAGAEIGRASCRERV